MILVVALLLFGTATAPAVAAPANAGLPRAGANPLTGLSWGVTRDDSVWTAYAAASGRDRRRLARIALRPRTVWLGFWFGDDRIAGQARQAVLETQNGNPDALVQLATFELNPWEGQTRQGGWDVAGEEHWYDGLAAGIGSARAFVIEQVDLPFALQTPSSAPETVDAYGARTLAALPHTTVYIDAGAYQWSTPAAMASLLIRSGIRWARGFALNVTQYGSVPDEVAWGAEIVAALARDGMPGKHFIVNTDENGSPYLAGQIHGNSNDTPVCASRGQRLCQRTGIPPTVHVAAQRWHLPVDTAATAARETDAYVWAGRPWDVNAGPFMLSWAITLGAQALY